MEQCFVVDIANNKTLDNQTCSVARLNKKIYSNWTQLNLSGCPPRKKCHLRPNPITSKPYSVNLFFIYKSLKDAKGRLFYYHKKIRCGEFGELIRSNYIIRINWAFL